MPGQRLGYRRTLAVDADSAGGILAEESGLAVALRGLRTVHGARVALCHSQLDLGDAAPGRHPLARHVLFAGDLAHGDSAVKLETLPFETRRTQDC